MAINMMNQPIDFSEVVRMNIQIYFYDLIYAYIYMPIILQTQYFLRGGGGD